MSISFPNLREADMNSANFGKEVQFPAEGVSEEDLERIQETAKRSAEEFAKILKG